MTTLTDRTLVVAERFYDVLNANKVSLGIADVWFGDQELVPRTPSLCVEPGLKRREMRGVPDMTLLEIDTYFLIYHSKLSTTGGEQQQRRNCIGFAEAIETYLNQNHLRLHAANGDQLTLYGYCVEVDPGYAYKSDSRFHAVQMTWRSTSKKSLTGLA